MVRTAFQSLRGDDRIRCYAEVEVPEFSRFAFPMFADRDGMEDVVSGPH